MADRGDPVPASVDAIGISGARNLVRRHDPEAAHHATVPADPSLAADLSAHLLNASSQAILLVDANGAVLAATPVALDLLGPDATGTELPSLEEIAPPMAALLRAGSSSMVELGMGGRIVRWEVTGFSATSRHQGLRLVTGEDVTEPRRLSDRLQVAEEEARRAIRESAEFMAITSHQLRSNLNDLVGFAEILADEMMGPMQPRSYVEIANSTLDSAKRLLKVTDSILDARIIESAVIQGESAYKDLVELSPDLICICRDNAIQLINGAGVNKLVLSAEDAAVGRKLVDFVHPEDRDLVTIDLPDLLTNPWSTPIRFVNTRGEELLLEVTVAGLKGLGNGTVMLVGRDVSEEREAVRALVAREKRLRAVMDAAGDAILTLDEGIRVETCNPAAERMFGHLAGDLFGRNALELFHDDGTGGLLPLIEEAGDDSFAGSHGAGWELVGLRRDGTEFPVHMTLSVVRVDRQKLFIAIVRDLSENKTLATRLSYLASHDPLTDLPNRTLLRDRLEQAIAFALPNNRQVVVLVVDLDGFTRVNDSFGHQSGDQVLRTIAHRLVDSLPSTHTVARVGADEFFVVAPNVRDLTQVMPLVNDIRAAIERPISLRGEELSISCSIGISAFPKDGGTADELIGKATTALHSFKGPHSASLRFFDSHMTTVVAQRLKFEHEFRRALERDELCVYFQPQIAATDGTLIGVEALVRWLHPNRGLILPGRFIPIAEELGLVQVVDMWVLEQACQVATQWRDNGLADISVSVNLSAVSFLERDLPLRIGGVLAQYGLEPRCLEIELTEGVLMNDVEQTVEALRALRSLGVRIAIDDFGTGYSSLAYLKRFPIDTIKIDREFIRSVHTAVDNQAIVSAIISLAHALGLKTVAEGVENEGEASFLAARGCDLLQGFLVSHAVPHDEIPRLVERRRKVG